MVPLLYNRPFLFPPRFLDLSRLCGKLFLQLGFAYYTPGSGEHGNPVFNRGSGGGARVCGFEERVGVHARTEGGHFL